MTFKPVDTAIVMVVGPCIDDSDFKTLEEAIAWNAAGMDVSLIVEKTNGTTAVTAITLTTGGTSDWTHKDGGYYEVEITAAQNAEEGIAYVRGVCTGVLPFESAHYNIVKANIYDSWIKGTDFLKVSIQQIYESTQSAQDLKDFADAGYDPATNKVQGVVLTDTCTTNTDMVGTDNAALAATALTDVTWTDAKAGHLDAPISTVDTVVDGIQTDLSNATDGLGALKALIDTIDGVVDTILADTNELQTNQGNWLTATGFSTHSAANVWAVATRILTANTNFNDLDAAAVKAEVVAALADIKLDHLINIAVDTNWATTVHLDSVIGHLADVGTAATFDRTTDAQEAIRDRGDAEWITATGFNTVVPDAAGVAPTVGEIRTEMEGAGTKLLAIEGDTNELQTDWVNGGRLDNLLDACNTVVPDAAGVAPTAAEIKTAVEQAGSSIAQILADTDNLQTNQGGWATATTVALNAQGKLDVNAEVDTALADIKLDHLLNIAVDTNWATTVHLDSVIGHMADVGTAATFNRTTDALEAIRNRGDAAWVTATGFNTTTPPTVTQIRQEMDTNSTKMAPSQVLADYKATGFNTVVPDAAGVAATPAEVATALTDIHLDHLLATDYDPASKPGVATALLNELIESDGGISRYTANALEQAPSAGTDPNVLIDTTIASVSDQTHFILTAGSNDNDAYKDQVIVIYDANDSDFPSIRVCSGYVGATKTITLDSAPDFTIVSGDGCRAFVTVPVTTAPTVGQIRAEMEGAGYKLATIEADTNELQTNQGNWATATGFNTVVPDAAGIAAGLHATTDGLITTVDTVADGIQTDLSNATDGLGALKALIDANQTDLTNIESKVDTVDTVADGIQTDLSNGTDGLGALKTLIDTIDGVVDTILTDTGTTLDGKLDTILGLGQENFFIDNTTYAGGNMTGARVRIYSVAGSVGTASDVIATYTVTATYAGSEMTDYKVVKS